MKHFKKIIMWTMLLFGVFIIGLHIASSKLVQEVNHSRNVVMNHIVQVIQSKYDVQDAAPDKILETIYTNNMSEWEQNFGKRNLPISIRYEELRQNRENVNLQIGAENNSYIWNLYGEDNQIIGFIVFEYEDDIYPGILCMADVIIMIAAIIVLVFALFVYFKILKPFERFSEYPKRLSKGEITDKLQESPNRYFGEYVWGMNMLTDKLAEDKNRIQKLSKERQTFVSTIAHGIKTPVSTIKLYADAISTGLYQEDGVVNEKDAQIADKIGKNAQEIECLVTEMIRVSGLTVFEYEPKIARFYLKELENYVIEEYTNRLNMKRIPFSVDVQGNPMLNSDKDGICRVLGQLIDNAIKYGDGTGIILTMEKQEDGYYFSVKNKGKGLPANEIPYVFNCFWRGSNAEDMEGSGIGLYEARRIIRSLGGDIHIKNRENEVEVAMWIPDEEN